MKTNEAIELLEEMSEEAGKDGGERERQALRLAIDALKVTQLPHRSPYLLPKERAKDALSPMMTPEKAIELLSDCCDRHGFTLCLDFYEAVRIGKDALIHAQLKAEATRL